MQQPIRPEVVAIDWAGLAERVLERNGCKQHELARDIGVHQSTVSRLLQRRGSLDANHGVRLLVLAGGRVELPPDMGGNEGKGADAAAVLSE